MEDGTAKINSVENKSKDEAYNWSSRLKYSVFYTITEDRLKQEQKALPFVEFAKQNNIP